VIVDEKILYNQYLTCPVTLIGAGGIGSNLLALLVKCGPTQLTIWDNDLVKPVNLAQQQFKAADVGESKAEVLAYTARTLDPTLTVVSKTRRFSHRNRLDGLVIAGVDSVKSRHHIFGAVMRQAERVSLFIDGRLSRQSNEWVELYFIDPKKDDEVECYREWLFDKAEVGDPGPRPTKLSAHTPILLAGLLGTVLARWVHENRHPWKVTMDASSFTLDAFWGDTT
jgi:hypothetical protein